MNRKHLTISLACLVSAFYSSYALSQTAASEHEFQVSNSKPKIAIIIDDLGHSKAAGEAIIELNIPLAVAVLPQTTHSEYLAQYAHKRKHDVMLHLPMQPFGNEELITPHTLSIDMDRTQFEQLVTASIEDIPHVIGVNNHMGSLFTQLPSQMTWLMQHLKSHTKPLFFVDSLTSDLSVAQIKAEEHSIPNTKRDVFLDRELTPHHMHAQFDKLKSLAIKNGQVVVIGHPFKETLSLLKQYIPELQQQGFEFVRVSSLVQSATTQAPTVQVPDIQSSFIQAPTDQANENSSNHEKQAIIKTLY